MKNLTYIISNINKSLAFEWIAEGLDPSKFKLSFILLNSKDTELEQYLKAHNHPCERINYRGKKDLLKAFWKIYKCIKRYKTDVVHTHLFDASFIGLIAAKFAGLKKRISTRHHGTSQHVYFPKAVKYDLAINRMATDIVAISENVKKVLIDREGVSPDKTHLIHHGFPLEEFDTVEAQRVQTIKKRYNPNNKAPVIGVIARYTEWKGVQYIIPAFKKVLKKHPNALLVLANASGNYLAEIKSLLKDIPKENIMEIVFENDLQALFHFFDLYVHTPIDPHLEAFGQTYVEALASGIPSIFTQSGIASEFITDKHNALVVPFKDTEAIYEKIMLLLEDTTLKDHLINNGKESVRSLFTLKMHLEKLTKLYVS